MIVLHRVPTVIRHYKRREDLKRNRAMPDGPRCRRFAVEPSYSVSSIAGIAIAVFAASWFVAALVSGAGQ